MASLLKTGKLELAAPLAPHPCLALPPAGSFVAPKATHLSLSPLHPLTIVNPEAIVL